MKRFLITLLIVGFASPCLAGVLSKVAPSLAKKMSDIIKGRSNMPEFLESITFEF